MNIETLYPLVSEAIQRAEVLEDLHAPGARDAWHDVSLLEESIAGILSLTGTQGAIARRGAISAAISAGEFRRAIDLADRFIREDGGATPLSDRLQSLRAQAIAARSKAEIDLEKQYQVAGSRWGFGAIQSFVHAYRQQGAPLPIR